MSTPPLVLIVDDYADALDVWALYLRSAGFSVVTAPDGRAAIDAVRRDAPDVVIMDLELPGLTGLEVARLLRSDAATQALPLIAATGYSHEAQIEEARQCGFDAVLVKPCDPEAMVNEIWRLLGRAGH